MVDYRLKDLRGPRRRTFLKWFGAAGAALGLERSKVLDVLAGHGGVALADACGAANRSVHIIGGNGSFAWFQLLWPHNEVALPTNAGKGFAYLGYGAGTNTYTPMTGMGNTFTYGPQAPFMSGGVPTRPMSAFICGKNETHTTKPASCNQVGLNASMIAACQAIQAPSLSAIVPVIAVGFPSPSEVPTDLGTAAGAPSFASVSDGSSMIDLFGSVASSHQLALVHDAQLYDTYYKAFLGLRYAANLPTNTAQSDNAKKAADLLGLNYGKQLTPTATDLQAYGINTLQASTATPTQKTGFTNLANALCIGAKALRAGLTNSLIIAVSPGPTGDTTFTDPHITFSDASHMGFATDSLTALGTMLNQFYADLAVPDPVCGSQGLDKSVVLTVHGDTPHDSLTASGWPDMPQVLKVDYNWMYVMGNGYVKPGWFGGLHVDGSCDSFDPHTGMAVPLDMQDVTVRTYAAGAAVAYAVAQGNKNTVAPFYTGMTPYDGIVV